LAGFVYCAAFRPTSVARPPPRMAITVSATPCHNSVKTQAILKYAAWLLLVIVRSVSNCSRNFRRRAMRGCMMRW
jgi:hypothetical protein